MEIQYLLEGLGFYLWPSLLVSLTPTAIVVAVPFMMKSSANWMPIFLCLIAGGIMWCDLAYWSTQGFLLFPFGRGVPTPLTNLLILLCGIMGGIAVYRGAINYKKAKKLSGISLIVLGYFIFVTIAFLILNNRAAA